MTTATDTPRTEAEIFEIQDCNGQLRKVITTQFAKQLERELAESKAEVERLRDAILKAINAFDKIRWGWDGHCGSYDIFAILEDSLNPTTEDSSAPQLHH